MLVDKRDMSLFCVFRISHQQRHQRGGGDGDGVRDLSARHREGQRRARRHPLEVAERSVATDATVTRHPVPHLHQGVGAHLQATRVLVIPAHKLWRQWSIMSAIRSHCVDAKQKPTLLKDALFPDTRVK